MSPDTSCDAAENVGSEAVFSLCRLGRALAPQKENSALDRLETLVEEDHSQSLPEKQQQACICLAKEYGSKQLESKPQLNITMYLLDSVTE
ncbi:hypothetical protein Trydic_g5861 [Trypoxylus dichotomus]